MQGQASLGESDPSLVSSLPPDEHANVQEQAVFSEKEVQ